MIFKTPAEQLRAHLLMIANTDGAPVYWLHVAQIYAELPGRPILLLGRAQSCAILRVQWQERGVIRIAYKEAGLYFEPEADRPLSQFKNPVTGKITPVQTSFREEPATYTYTATDKGVFGNTQLEPNRTRQMPWTWGSSGPRVWMVDEEAGLWAKAEPPSAKIQQREPLAGRILQTWHADIHDLEDSRITLRAMLQKLYDDDQRLALLGRRSRRAGRRLHPRHGR